MKTKWPFTAESNAAVFTTRDIIEEGKPVLLFTHDQNESSWQL
jgi:hypothetical protein